MTRFTPAGLVVVVVTASVLVVGCAGGAPEVASGAIAPSPRSRAPSTPPSEPGSKPPGDLAASATGQTSSPPATDQPSSAGREPPRSFLTVPAIGLSVVPVVRYSGRPDDAQGTRIQDQGPTASPRGPGGGVGPGEVGNFIVTGHRTSHSAPFRDLPALRAGDRVRVRTGRNVFVYRITTTRRTSFRSARSRAEQTAAVPGRPGMPAKRAMITLSTCATPEDHAAGNYWSDRFGNPEHRIDKVGVLVRWSRTRT